RAARLDAQGQCLHHRVQPRGLARCLPAPRAALHRARPPGHGLYRDLAPAGAAARRRRWRGDALPHRHGADDAGRQAGGAKALAGVSADASAQSRKIALGIIAWMPLTPSTTCVTSKSTAIEASA